MTDVTVTLTLDDIKLYDRARAIGLPSIVISMYGDRIKKLLAEERESEREACAKVCDELPAPDIYSDADKSMWDVTCMDCAAAIRARGKEPCVHEWIDDTKAKPAWRCIKCGSDYKKEQA